MSTSPATAPQTDSHLAVTLERRGHVLLIGLNRPEKRNAFNLEMLDELSLAYGELEADPELRVGVLHAHGEHFTSGLGLAEVGAALIEGRDLPKGGRDPWRNDGKPLTKR